MAWKSVMAIVLVAICGHSIGMAAQAEEPQDPWVGTYVKYIDYPDRDFDSVRITITKEGDTYSLSKPYQHWKFKETEKGVLSTAPGGIGQLYLGTVKFADGTETRLLRADFCYEWFILYEGNIYPKSKGPEKLE